VFWELDCFGVKDGVFKQAMNVLLIKAALALPLDTVDDGK